MENSIFIIICYKLDYKNALKVKHNLEELGIDDDDIHIVIGYNHKELGKSVSYTLHKSFTEKIIPYVLEQKERFLLCRS